MNEEQHADVVVVGFGLAGACAAIESARAGAEVILLDRFTGGGATALSGGIVYAGATSVQREAGVTDTTEAMFDYLRAEVGDAVSERTLRRFCEQSPELIRWLQDLGVPFEGSLCPYKTSYPNDRYYLYYSGSEISGRFRDEAAPAPRGHRVKGPGTSGKLLFTVVEKAVRDAGVRVVPQTQAVDLVRDEAGAVVGVDCRSLAGAPARVRRRHRWLSRFAAKPGLYLPALSQSLHSRAERLERRHGSEVRFTARRGVVLAAGGFVAHREMMRNHAPRYRKGLALGTKGDDGSGIRLGVRVGGLAERLGTVSAWRFITPPSALLGSVLVDEQGRRICDESRYGAAVGEAMVRGHGGRGWLLVDAELRAEAGRQIAGQALWFQRLQAKFLLGRAAVTAPTLKEVAQHAGIDPDGLRSTVEQHNHAALNGLADPAGKPAEFVRAALRPPYSLIDVSIKPSRFYPCPMLTLGGLAVDEESGQVRSAEGGVVSGLYAAGRTAVGICSHSYVSGLSLADCVFSGRRAGAHLGSASTNRRFSAHP